MLEALLVQQHVYPYSVSPFVLAVREGQNGLLALMILMHCDCLKVTGHRPFLGPHCKVADKLQIFDLVCIDQLTFLNGEGIIQTSKFRVQPGSSIGGF